MMDKLIKKHLKKHPDHAGYPLRGIVAQAQRDYSMERLKEGI